MARALDESPVRARSICEEKAWYLAKADSGRGPEASTYGKVDASCAKDDDDWVKVESVRVKEALEYAKADSVCEELV